MIDYKKLIIKGMSMSCPKLLFNFAVWEFIATQCRHVETISQRKMDYLLKALGRIQRYIMITKFSTRILATLKAPVAKGLRRSGSLWCNRHNGGQTCAKKPTTRGDCPSPLEGAWRSTPEFPGFRHSGFSHSPTSPRSKYREWDRIGHHHPTTKA